MVEESHLVEVKWFFFTKKYVTTEATLYHKNNNNLLDERYWLFHNGIIYNPATFPIFFIYWRPAWQKNAFIHNVVLSFSFYVSANHKNLFLSIRFENMLFTISFQGFIFAFIDEIYAIQNYYIFPSNFIFSTIKYIAFLLKVF